MADGARNTYPEDDYHYSRTFFDPETDLIVLDREQAMEGGDRPQGSPYDYTEEIIFAVNAALAARRPLLVAGPAGTGKTSLAANIAAQQGWLYFSKVITGTTQWRDLLWTFDAVRRLSDATMHVAPPRSQDPDPLPAHRYMTRGAMWEAFEAGQQGKRAVVLIDEIDKADPEVPNGLLEVLASGRFTFEETGEPITAGDGPPPMVVITTNDEREISRPFRRRCVTLTLEAPDAGRLVDIARSWGLADANDGLARTLANEVEQLSSGGDGSQHSPNAAEYLDALRTCIKLGITIPGAEWEAVKKAILLKVLRPGDDG
jgi:MoxR-like ATPase